MKRLLKGLHHSLRGFGLLRQNRTLSLLAIAPFLLHCLLFLIGLYLVAFQLGDITASVVTRIPYVCGEWTTHSWYLALLSRMSWAACYLAKIIAFLTMTGLLFLSLYLVGALCSAPIYDFLSEATETYLGKKEMPFSWRNLFRSIVVTLKVESQKIILILVFLLLTFLLNLIPVVGIALHLIVVHLYAALAFSFTFLDYPMSRRNWTLKKRLGFIRSHWLEALGFGLAFFVPGFNLVGGPGFVSGATTLFLELNQE